MSDGVFFVGLRFALFVFSVVAVGFFSASETAFIASDKWVLERLSKEGDKRAAILRALNSNPKDTISAVLIGINVFTVLASVVASSIAFSLGLEGALSVALVSLVTTAVLFMFSELVPKIRTADSPTERAISVASALAFTTNLFKPISLVLNVIPALLVKALFKKESVPSRRLSDQPVRVAADLAEEDGFVNPEDTEVIYGVLDSSDKRVADVMIPIERAVTFRPGITLKAALENFKENHFSRIPVLSVAGDRVLGTVYIKDVIRHIMRAPEDADKSVTTVMRKPCTASPQENVLDLLSKLKRKKVHLAVVTRDETPAGIVTLEDLLEEILGDIPEDARAMREHPAPILRGTWTGSRQGFLLP